MSYDANEPRFITSVNAIRANFAAIIEMLAAKITAVITSPEVGDTLVFDGEKFVNGPPSSGGLSLDDYNTLSVGNSSSNLYNKDNCLIVGYGAASIIPNSIVVGSAKSYDPVTVGKFQTYVVHDLKFAGAAGAGNWSTLTFPLRYGLHSIKVRVLCSPPTTWPNMLGCAWDLDIVYTVNGNGVITVLNSVITTIITNDFDGGSPISAPSLQLTGPNKGKLLYAGGTPVAGLFYSISGLVTEHMSLNN
jgi:hypothetical protein